MKDSQKHPLADTAVVSPQQYQSEHVVIESPMSFTGATKRICPIVANTTNPYMKWLVAIPCVTVLLLTAYSFIIVWYAVFGLLLIPFRLIRRSQRKSKRQALQHREVMDALSRNKVA